MPINAARLVLFGSIVVVFLAFVYHQWSSTEEAQLFMLGNILKRSIQLSANVSTKEAAFTARNNSMATVAHAKIVPRRSADRMHSDLGWLDSYHTFSFAGHHDPRFEDFGSLRVLNEDRVAPQTGFPTHPHRDYEIFSYVLSGELTHRDSLHGHGEKGASKDDFFVMKRGDVQFTTGGTGIAHSEQNEHANHTVHFLQIWVKPWARGLPPIYHTSSIAEATKRRGFAVVISPLAAGKMASKEDEKKALPSVQGSIPIHADFVMGAAIVPPGQTFSWKVGADAVHKANARRVYVHFPKAKDGRSKLKLNGAETLQEGDGAFVSGVNAGDELVFESVGVEEAEVVVLDSD